LSNLSENIIKNGSIHNGKQKYACKDCNRQFVLEPENCIFPEKKDLIDKLLLEKIPKAGIARAVEVSERWLQNYVNEKYDAVKKEIDVTPKKKGKITIQCDEMWYFVMNKDNKQWIWLGSRHRNRGNCRSLYRHIFAFHCEYYHFL